jgi:hypothetical protein
MKEITSTYRSKMLWQELNISRRKVRKGKKKETNLME